MGIIKKYSIKKSKCEKAKVWCNEEDLIILKFKK